MIVKIYFSSFKMITTVTVGRASDRRPAGGRASARSGHRDVTVLRAAGYPERRPCPADSVTRQQDRRAAAPPNPALLLLRDVTR